MLIDNGEEFYEAKKQCQDLKHDIKLLQSKYSLAQSSKAKLNQENARLKQAIDSHDSIREALQQELNEARKTIENLKSM